MPVPTQLHSLRITPLVHDPKETKVDFGATVEGVDLNDVDPETFAVLRDAVLKYRLLVFKGQSRLEPKNQLAFVQRFSPGSNNFSHALDPNYLKRRGVRPVPLALHSLALPAFLPAVPSLLLLQNVRADSHDRPAEQRRDNPGRAAVPDPRIWPSPARPLRPVGRRLHRSAGPPQNAQDASERRRARARLHAHDAAPCVRLEPASTLARTPSAARALTFLSRAQTSTARCTASHRLSSARCSPCTRPRATTSRSRSTMPTGAARSGSRPARRLVRPPFAFSTLSKRAEHSPDRF